MAFVQSALGSALASSDTESMPLYAATAKAASDLAEDAMVVGTTILTVPEVVDAAFDEVESFEEEDDAVLDVVGAEVGVRRTAVDDGALLTGGVLGAGALDNVLLVVAGAPDELDVQPENSSAAVATVAISPCRRISDTPHLGSSGRDRIIPSTSLQPSRTDLKRDRRCRMRRHGGWSHDLSKPRLP